MIYGLLVAGLLGGVTPPLPSFSTACRIRSVSSPHQPGVQIDRLSYGADSISVQGHTIAYSPSASVPRELLYFSADGSTGYYTTLAPVDGYYGSFELIVNRLSKGWHVLRLAIVSDTFGADAASYTEICFPVGVPWTPVPSAVKTPSGSQ